MTATSGADTPRRTLYGRRQGPKLRPGRREVLETGLAACGIELPATAGLDPRSLFPDAPREVWLEIGFGGGEHLAEQAAAHPEVGLIGVEPFRNGVAKLLDRVRSERLANVRVLVDDARLLLAALPDAAIDRIFVLFPDPWPKVRHHKRRIVNAATVAEFARLLRPGGEARFATDDPGYAQWMLAAALAEPRLAWLAESAADWRDRPADWPATRYEAKALAAGRRPVFLRFRRLPPA